MDAIAFPHHRALGCITVGRANVDFYPTVGERLGTARMYDVFVGGSPANIAIGLVRLGIPCGIITKVAQDSHGMFVADYLKHHTVDIAHVQFDTSGAKTSLAFAERRRDAETIMYRNHVADLLLSPHEIDKEYVAQSKSVFISGTALAINPSREAVLRVLQYASESSAVKVMDIDYRPYGWDTYDETSAVLSNALEQCDIIIGTRDEFNIAIGDDHVHLSDKECADLFLSKYVSLVVIKRGKDGASCFLRDGTEITSVALPANMIKPYGAGDAFASAFLASLLKEQSIEYALEAGAASASLNISEDSCTEAMPTQTVLDEFIRACKEGTIDKKEWSD